MVSSAELLSYQQNGFYIVPDVVIAPAVIENLRERVQAILRGTYNTGVAPWRLWNVGDESKVQKIDQVHLADKAFFELVTQSPIGQWAAKITGAKRIQLWATQLFYKPAQGGDLGNIGWHADEQYWKFWQGEVFTAWLALSEITQASGPLTFVKGSHQWESDGGDAYCQDLEIIKANLIKGIPAGEKWQEVSALLPAGGLSFHHRKIWHGSAANYSNQARCSIAINLRVSKSAPVQGVEDFGYCAYLDDTNICPILF